VAMHSPLERGGDRGESAPQWFIEALATPPEQLQVDVMGAAIETLAWGPRGAPGLLLMHGYRGHARWWSHLAPLLSSGHRVVALSWSGMGGSGGRQSYTFDHYLKEALAAARIAGLFDSATAPILIGHSMGGYVAALLAARPAPRWRGAILIDVNLSHLAPSPFDVPHKLFGSLEEGISRFRFVPGQESKSYIHRMIAESSLVAIRESNSGTATPEGWAWCFDPQLASKAEFNDVWDHLSRPCCPLVFMRGDRSSVVSIELEKRHRAQAPAGSVFISIAEGGHHLQVDQPLAMVTAIRTVLATWEAADQTCSSPTPGGRAG
jgi:pimeloyl-ACP methyl ester carboxylesterase